MNMKQNNLDIVYVLTNSAMPGLVKIGNTSQDDPAVRLSQLYTTGVPVPFDIEYACRVPNPLEVEQALHRAFAPQRINPRREFFEIEPEQAIAILQLLNVEDVTQDVALSDDGIDSTDRESASRLRSRRPSINFDEMDIPNGSRLTFNTTDDYVIVVAHKKVIFNDGEPTSLTAVTREILGLDYNIQPTRHWSFDGRNLRDIWSETYVTSD
ncbi:GIY-YIG nuclease family protein [Mariniblastus sp.]|nr:GIY-YIG nuclease family protein [Mariniblastus sp.]